MKLKELIEISNNNPEILEYDIALSHYLSVPDPSDEEKEAMVKQGGTEETLTKDPYYFISDFPIRGVAACDDSKELRFVLFYSDTNALEQTNSRLLALYPPKKK